MYSVPGSFSGYYTTFNLVSLTLLLTVTLSQTFLVFGDLDSFEDYWLDVSYNISVRIYHVFFPSPTGVTSFRVQDHGDEVPFSSCYWHTLSVLPLTCDTDLDHLSKVVCQVYSLKSYSPPPPYQLFFLMLHLLIFSHPFIFNSSEFFFTLTVILI